MSKKNEATAEATAEATETGKKAKTLASRMKAAIAGFITQVNATEAPDGDLVDVTLSQSVYDAIMSLGGEVIANATRGLPFEVKLQALNEQIAAFSMKTRNKDGSPRPWTAEETKEIEDLLVKKRNLENRNKQNATAEPADEPADEPAE